MRAARSYGPVASGAALFLVMSLVVSPVDRPEEVLAGSIDVPLAAGGPLVAGAPDGEAGQSSPTDTPTSGPGGGSAAPAAAGSPAGGSSSDSGGGGAGSGDGSTGGVQACQDRAAQVPGDPYSPPCFTFRGDNGGKTSKGVTKDEIIVTIRQLEGPTAAQIFADISGEAVNDSPEAVVDTIEALGRYFSDKFQFYGRRIKFVFYKGQGIGAAELLGGGKEAAQSDAVKASELGAFADLSGITIPYSDALSREKIVAFGAPYPSRKWFVTRRPYTWALFPDGTNVVESAVSWISSRLVPQPTAQYAGPAYRGDPRKYAVLAPENAEYQESVDVYLERVAEAGIKISMNLKYKLDISSMPNQASNIIAQMKDADVTSVICACDPVMLALGLTPKANEQDYEPEWITSGLAFVDQDIVSQLIEDRQWSRAFGIAYNAESEPQGRSYPYAAYKQIRPTDEPAFGVEEIYYAMYMMAIGIHMAGPNLTPQTFEAGMFTYPGGSGPRGAWSFGEGDYTPTDDFREIWWDTTAISQQNNRPGAWIQLNGGQRYFPGQVPVKSAPYFQR